MRSSATVPLVLSLLIAGDLVAQSPLRYPDVGGNQIRVEAHLLPAVSTGPLDPAWSPDGEWIAFSMRGDIWKIPAGGGEAVALTRGPAYHFEPAWSPDGRRVALTVDLDGNLEIALVSAEGGEVRRLTDHPQVDVQPAWSADGRGIYFSSARDGGFDIHFLDLESGAVTPVVAGRGHQIQPAPSPDGGELAYVSPVPGRLGSGGLWRTPLPSGEPRLVHYEETSYRAKPRWTPDGGALLYVSDEAGSNDVAVVPAEGGSPLRLTQDAADEYSPVPSPDGSRIAFVSNRGGPTRLFTMPVGGARRAGWGEVAITDLDSATPTGTLRVEVRGPSGEAFPARIYLRASDGRAYAPEGGFHRVISATETHYFHTPGTFEVEVPAGPVTVEAMGGFEYAPASATATVREGETAELVLRLERLVDAPALGWYSGETHAHDLHQGRFGLSHEAFFNQLLAEDLRVTNALIHMDGTRVMGRWADLTGEPHPLSTPHHLLQYGQEFRGSLGHIGMLGIHEFAMPLIGGTSATPFAADVPNYPYVDAAHAQGGIAGFMHPYTRPVEEPDDGAGSEIAVDVALGRGDFYDVVCIWYDELGNAEMYYRYLNAGFRLPATGGSDNFADVWRDPPPGTARTYALLDGPLSVEAWLAAVEAGRTFSTNGPLLFMEVEGRSPGEEIRVEEGAPADFQVALEVASIAPLDRVEVVVNGEVVRSVDVSGRGSRFGLDVPVELATSGWIAVRAVGPSSRWVSDSYAFAQTSPVYVVRGGETFTSAEDARFLAAMVDAFRSRLEDRGTFASDAARERFMDAIARAREVYQGIAASGTSR